MKKFSHNTRSDSSLLQDDLDKFVNCVDVNCMQLNLGKCKHMHFSRTIKIYSRFNLHGSLTDLGILIVIKLNLNNRIVTMVNKAYGVLGFIKRWVKEIS